MLAHFRLQFILSVQDQTLAAKKCLETTESVTRLAAQKIVKALNKVMPSDDILLPNKLLQELRTKYTAFPPTLADLESEIMNFNAQLSCQGTVKDDVSERRRVAMVS